MSVESSSAAMAAMEAAEVSTAHASPLRMRRLLVQTVAWTLLLGNAGAIAWLWVHAHTRRPPSGVHSVTVVGPSLGTADAYATAASAMGGELAAHWTARLPSGYEAMTILADETVLSTAQFPA